MNKHADNYKDNIIQQNIRKSLSCFNEIVQIMQGVESDILISELKEYDKELTYKKALAYSKIHDAIRLYFPNRLGDSENDNTL